MKTYKMKFLNSLTLISITIVNLVFALINRVVLRDWEISIFTLTVATGICVLTIIYNFVYYLKDRNRDPDKDKTKPYNVLYFNTVTLSILTAINLTFGIINRAALHDWDISIMTITFATLITILTTSYNYLYYKKEKQKEKK